MSEADQAPRLNRLHAVASGINAAIVRIPGEVDLFREACRIAVERGGLMMAWVGRDDPALGKLTPVAHWGRDEGYIDSIHISTESRYREGQGPGGTAWRTGAPSICNDIENDHQFFAYREQALAQGYRSCAAFPLKVEGKVTAVFLVYAAQPLYFDPGEMDILTSLAENLSFGLEARERDVQRRQMESALRASEARLRAVIETEPECVKDVSLDGKLIDINRAGLLMIQATTPDEVVGRTVTDIIHPDDREAFHALHDRVAVGGTGELQFRAQGLQGRTLWMDTHAVPLRGEDGAIASVLYVTRDVTQQHGSIERLRHQKALLTMASRLGRIGAWEVELASMENTWSDELFKIYELPAGPSPSLEAALSFIALEDRAPFIRAFDACAREGTGFDFELNVFTVNGRRLSARTMGEAVRDNRGTIRCVQGAFQDITDRVVAEEEIRGLAEQLATTLESITDALVTVDANWRFTYVNREAERVLRRSRAQLLGTDMWEQFPQGRGTAFEDAYLRALKQGETVELQSFYPPLDTWLEIRAYPSREGGLTIYFRDIGERLAAQAEIQRLNVELEQRVRQRTGQLEMANEELRAFSYSIAHDLRAPLAAISGFSHALQHEMGGSLGDRARHCLERMQEGVLRTSGMIDALLSLAQLSRAELRWERVNLSAMAETAIQTCRLQDPARRVESSVEPGLTAHGDPRLLQLVFDNLIGNAWKFSARTDRAVVSFASIAGPEGEVVYEVRDNGIGFEPAYAQNLFGAFQRLHAHGDFPGWGIGLANVRRIVARHSGRIWAHSRPDQGASFYFTLGDEPA
ncbi:PAS domain-containing protein [Caenimonas aquaedulcis]|uniref:histidine kinase n=1 Tax=Caenimonas aquaedulcis TaxID=2793270 RepID=A0A931H235_9BURK|nr:PAS domain-containing protein [Caenimonas aquaedulcis]MBG9387141.1 PAS domain-containing protein [Caenimonas aquaedulcis]